MIDPHNDHEWEELFRKYTPDAPVPHAVSKYAREKLHQELQKKKQYRRNAEFHVNGYSALRIWLRDLPAMFGHLTVSPARAMLSVFLGGVIALAALFAGMPLHTVYAATVRVNDGAASILRARNSTTDYLTANLISYIEPGDELTVTSGSATITCACFDGQSYQVLSGARVKLVSMPQQGEAGRVQWAVWEGRMLIVLSAPNKSEDQVEVILPLNKVSLHSNEKTDSTAIIVDVQPNGDTSFVASEGSASVTGADGQIVNVQVGSDVVARAGRRLAVATRVDVAQVGSLLNPMTFPASTGPTGGGIVRTPTPGFSLPNPGLLPTPGATVQPMPVPVLLPTSVPTISPTPMETPTRRPTSTVSPLPTETFTPVPPTETPVPTITPTELPTYTPVPTETPSPAPTEAPRPAPTDSPHPAPTSTPVPPSETPLPTAVPTDTVVPTETAVPTAAPTDIPAPTATLIPTEVPTEVPTEAPTETPAPTKMPTPRVSPTDAPKPTDSVVVTATLVPIDPPWDQYTGGIEPTTSAAPADLLPTVDMIQAPFGAPMSVMELVSLLYRQPYVLPEMIVNKLIAL